MLLGKMASFGAHRSRLFVGLVTASVSHDGSPARRWAMWLAAALAALGQKTARSRDTDDLQAEWGPVLELKGSAVGVIQSKSVFVSRGNFPAFAKNHSRMLDNAMYLSFGCDTVAESVPVCHAKAAIVFSVTLVISWATSAALPRLLLRGLQLGAITNGPIERQKSHVTDFSAFVAESISRSAAIHRNGRRNRLLDRSCHRANGPVSEFRSHGDYDDRPLVGGPLDRAAWYEVF
jgi:hypothetical protein